MVSTCPSCKTPIEHEDYLFEVACQCGMRFNPFYDSGKTEPVPTPVAEVVEDFSVPELEGQPTGNKAAGFAESTSAFQEIVDFGESLSSGNSLVSSPGGSSSSPANRSKSSIGNKTSENSSPKISVPLTADNARPGAFTSDISVVLTSGETASGYRVERYFSPISAAAPLDLSSANPLGAGYLSLSQAAESLGANAVLGTHWCLTPDGTQAIFSGLPALIVKES